MDICHYYSIPPHKIGDYSPMQLSQMLSAMISLKARDRIHRVEEEGFQYMKESDRNKFLDILYKQMDDKYKESRSVGEDELKRILHGFR